MPTSLPPNQPASSNAHVNEGDSKQSAQAGSTKRPLAYASQSVSQSSSTAAQAGGRASVAASAYASDESLGYSSDSSSVHNESPAEPPAKRQKVERRGAMQVGSSSTDAKQQQAAVQPSESGLDREVSDSLVSGMDKVKFKDQT